MKRTALLILVALACFQQPGEAMIYHPATGEMWDPSVLYHDGTYYAFMMYDKTGRAGLNAGHCLLATSQDGVHWKDEGAIIQERDRSADGKFFKCFVGRCGDKFIMDHGVMRKQGQDTLRFYQSTDLKNWTYLSSSQPDTRWYVRPGRWDCMYILPKEEGNSQAGYWGYVVAVPKQGVDLPGMMQSPDGVNWEALPPAKAEWGHTPSRNHLEYGGCERIGGKYYLIGGTTEYMGNRGYSMYTMVADGPRGPFRPDVEAFRLSGASYHHVSWLAGWARGKDGELLISNYASPNDNIGHPWMLPLRKAVVDKAGHLRMGWWKGNEALKGEPLSLQKRTVRLDAAGKPSGYDMLYLDTSFNPGQGLVLEGTIKARPISQGKAAAGFVLQEDEGQAMAVQLGIGKPQQREAHIGRLKTTSDGKSTFQSEDVTGKGCATVTGIDDGREHTFRLLVRMDFFELYIDDLLMQTYRYNPGRGKVGFLASHATVEINDLRAWHMSLEVPASYELKLWKASLETENGTGPILTR